MGILKKFFSKQEQSQLDEGLAKTKTAFFSKLGTALIGKSRVDDEVLDELEDILIQSDVGVTTTLKIIKALEIRVAKEKYLGSKALALILNEELIQILEVGDEQKEDQQAPIPYVIMVVGVNGVGKTTSIGKLAFRLKQSGKKVILGAGDTFRAGAIDQLQIWADRVGVPIVRQEMGSDPAAVAFDTLHSAIAQKSDVVLIDTAGRLHNKINLMNELSKVKRAVSYTHLTLPTNREV